MFENNMFFKIKSSYELLAHAELIPASLYSYITIEMNNIVGFTKNKVVYVIMCVYKPLCTLSHNLYEQVMLI